MKVSIGTAFTLFRSDPFATRIVSKTADVKQALVLGVHGPVGGAGGVEIGLSPIGVKTWKTEYIMKKIALLVLLSTLFFSYTEALGTYYF